MTQQSENPYEIGADCIDLSETYSDNFGQQGPAALESIHGSAIRWLIEYQLIDADRARATTRPRGKESS